MNRNGSSRIEITLSVKVSICLQNEINRHGTGGCRSHTQCYSDRIYQKMINTLRPRQNGRHFPDDIFKCIFLLENILIWIKISLKFVSKVRIDNIPAFVQIIAWHRPGDKPLSEPMVVSLLKHICVNRPRWVNSWMSRKCKRCSVTLVLNILLKESSDPPIEYWTLSC